MEGADESGSSSAWVVEGSLRTLYETQYDDRRTMGEEEEEEDEEEMWFFDTTNEKNLRKRHFRPYNCSCHHISSERCLIRQLQ